MTGPGQRRPHPRSLTIGALLTALTALGQMSTSLYIPSLPSLTAALGATTEQASLTLALFLLGFAPAQLLLGPLSDRYGRRPVATVGLGLYIAATLACALAPSIEMLLAGRFLQGMAACSGPVLSRAIIRDVYGPVDSAKAMAYVGAALAVSPAVAPVIGGYLQVWFGWRAAFVLLVVVGVILLVATERLLAETRPPPSDSAPLKLTLLSGYRPVIGVRRYWAHTLAVAFIFAALMAYTVASPFVFISLLGLAPQHYGMLALFTVAGYLAGSLAAGRLSGRLPAERLLAAGLALSLLGGAVLAGFVLTGALGIVAVIAPMAIVTAGMGLVFAVGIAGAMAPFRHVAGAASALLGFVQMTVAAAATTLLGLFPQTSAEPMALGVLISVLLAALSFGVLMRR